VAAGPRRIAPAGDRPLENGRDGSRVHAMDALNRITAIVHAVGPAHRRAAEGWRQALVVATLAGLAASAAVFLAT